MRKTGENMPFRPSVQKAPGPRVSRETSPINSPNCIYLRALEKVIEEKEHLRKIVDSFGIPSTGQNRLSSTRSFSKTADQDHSTTTVENNDFHNGPYSTTAEDYGLDGVHVQKQTVHLLFSQCVCYQATGSVIS